MNRTVVNRRYQIERKIGEGGMAEVYLGHDDLLHRPVAIKALRPQFAADAGVRARFEREAQAAASFSHPNIIDIFDVGEDEGTPFLVMEYVPGETLKEIIENEGPFHPDDVAILIEQVASALDYAHERGFVHRDIKPQNILVDDAGLAKVVDFGIAKGLADSSLTEAGSSLGTVHYVSPEQASGLMATPSSDIYSLAVVAYEMLTNRLPFDSDSSVGIAIKHINDQPRHPSLLNPEVPRQAGDIVLRALAKDPTRRFPTAGALAQALNEWRTYTGPGWTGAGAPPPAPKSPPPIPADLQATVPTMPVVAEPTPAPQPMPRRAQRSSPPVATPIATTAGGGATVAAEPLPMAGQRGINLGCVSWVVGAGVIAVLIGLIWFGGRLSDRLSGFGDDPDPTTTAATTEVAGLPTSTAIQVLPTNTVAVVADQPTATGEVAEANVTVPSLIGLTAAEAQETLDGLGLVLQYGDIEISPEIPEGKVSSHDPPAQTDVPPGTAVRVNLSSGPNAIDLASFEPANAEPDALEQRLLDAGLEVTRQQEPSQDVDEGLVIRLEPADRVRPGDTVTMFISAGNRVQIPADLQGQPLAEVRERLTGLGLTVANEYGVPLGVIVAAGIERPEDLGIEDGDVVGIQDGDAGFGAFVEPGASVSLVYYDASLDEQ